ncbi:MAG: hypothetical protein Q4B26_18110 [Eubacteriales bacterium]|nr:hypothetical protein [Eubacteriales bacterium]
MFLRYLRVDFQRMIKSPRTIIGILGVALMMFFSLESGLFEKGFGNGDVIFTYLDATNRSGYVIAYSFCALPFAAVYPEDWEHKYIRYGVIRGDLKAFVLAKAAVIYMSAVLTMVAGSMMFLLICRTQVPWVNPENSVSFELFLAGNYRQLLENGHIFLYCILYALHLGLFAGVLANMAAFCSVIVSNTVLTLIFPVLAWRVLELIYIKGINLNGIFIVTGKILGADLQNLLLAIAVSVFLSLLSALGCYCILKRKM